MRVCVWRVEERAALTCLRPSPLPTPFQPMRSSIWNPLFESGMCLCPEAYQQVTSQSTSLPAGHVAVHKRTT
eukprot:3423434-Rhodomonas_salina.1